MGDICRTLTTAAAVMYLLKATYGPRPMSLSSTMIYAVSMRRSCAVWRLWYGVLGGFSVSGWERGRGFELQDPVTAAPLPEAAISNIEG